MWQTDSKRAAPVKMVTDKSTRMNVHILACGMLERNLHLQRFPPNSLRVGQIIHLQAPVVHNELPHLKTCEAATHRLVGAPLQPQKQAAALSYPLPSHVGQKRAVHMHI